MYSSKFLVLIPQAHSEPNFDNYPSSPSTASFSSAASTVSDSSEENENNFLVLAPQHRRSSVSSVSSAASVDNISNSNKKRVRFLGLAPETRERTDQTARLGIKEPEIVPDTDYVNIMKPFRNGFLRLG